MENLKTRLESVIKELKSIIAAMSAPTEDPAPIVDPAPKDKSPLTMEPANPDQMFTHNGVDFYVADTQRKAKLGFEVAYGKWPVDTDPVNGKWYSASQRFSPADVEQSQTQSVNLTLIPHASDQVGDGWTQTPDGVIWTAGNRYSSKTPGIKTDGVLHFHLDLEPGNYVIRISARAAKQTPGRHDLHNDVWFLLDRSNSEVIFGLRKHFFSGRGQWTTSTSAEVGHTKLRNEFKIEKAGRYVLTMSGRSNAAEVSKIEIISE